MSIRVIALAALATTAACSSLRPVREPARYIAENNPPIVRVIEKQNGLVMTIAEPRVSGDSLVGRRAADNRPVAVPLDQVYTLSARRLSGGRTALLILGVLTVTGLTSYAMLANGADNNWECDYSSPAIGEEYSVPICEHRF